MFRRTIIITSLIVALGGTMAFAQGRREKARRNGFAGQLRGKAGTEDQIERLRQRLNLSESQTNGVRALAENRRKETESVQEDSRQKRQTLRQLLQQPNPNPNDVGNATLALKETRQSAREINQRFMSGVKALLTPDQLQKLPKGFAR